MGRRILVIGLAVAAVLAVAAIALFVAPTGPDPAAPPAAADVSDFEFESFDAVYRLDLDERGRSTARVTETIVAIFPEFDQNRGIIRAIPLRDQEYDLGVRVVGVSDERGQPVAWEREDVDGFAELALGTDEFVHGRTTYVIEYELRNVIRGFADAGVDEFYWDVNGVGWRQRFERVSARVELSSALAAALTGGAACYWGPQGATDRCEIAREGDALVAEAGPLGPRQTMTVAIGFAAGTAVQGERPRDSWIVTVLPWMLLGLSIALLIAAIAARAVLWRDVAPRRAIIAEYEPPEPRDLLLDGAVLRRPGPVFAAIIVELAVRGAARIVDRGADRPRSNRYEVEAVDRGRAEGTASGVLRLLFGKDPAHGERVALGTLPPERGASVHARLARARADAVKQRLLATPRASWPRWLRWAALAVVVAYAVPFTWCVVNDLGPDLVLATLFGSVVAGIVLAFVTSAPSLLTAKGADRRDHLRGVREYLTVAEQDRIRMLQSPEGAERVARAVGAQPGAPIGRDEIVKLNERLLPWAVLWGVEDRWAEVLRADYAAAGSSPSWVSSGVLEASVLQWAATSSSRVTPLASSSSGGSSWSGSGGSSFSSGSSGGGFSGGGGGGGGGGGR